MKSSDWRLIVRALVLLLLVGVLIGRSDARSWILSMNYDDSFNVCSSGGGCIYNPGTVVDKGPYIENGVLLGEKYEVSGQMRYLSYYKASEGPEVGGCPSLIITYTVEGGCDGTASPSGSFNTWNDGPFCYSGETSYMTLLDFMTYDEMIQGILGDDYTTEPLPTGCGDLSGYWPEPFVCDCTTTITAPQDGETTSGPIACSCDGSGGGDGGSGGDGGGGDDGGGDDGGGGSGGCVDANGNPVECSSPPCYDKYGNPVECPPPPPPPPCEDKYGNPVECPPPSCGGDWIAIDYKIWINCPFVETPLNFIGIDPLIDDYFLGDVSGTARSIQSIKVRIDPGPLPTVAPECFYGDGQHSGSYQGCSGVMAIIPDQHYGTSHGYSHPTSTTIFCDYDPYCVSMTGGVSGCVKTASGSNMHICLSRIDSNTIQVDFHNEGWDPCVERARKNCTFSDDISLQFTRNTNSEGNCVILYRIASGKHDMFPDRDLLINHHRIEPEFPWTACEWGTNITWLCDPPYDLRTITPTTWRLLP